MSSKTTSAIVSNLRPILFACLLIITSPVQADDPAFQRAASDPCASATPVDLNSSLRAYVAQGSEPFLVSFEVPSAGFLSVDVAVPGTATEPTLGLAHRVCGKQWAEGELQIIERSAGHLVAVAPSSGTYVFRISSQDSQLPLSDFKLRIGFVPDVPFQSTFGKDGEDEEEIEMEPDGLVYSGRDIFTKDGEDEEEIEMEPDGLVDPGQHGNRSLHAKLHELCRSGEVDDHGDSFACATFMSPGQSMSGEMGNGWGDDGDVFLFVLGSSSDSNLRTVEIETAGDVDTLGGLYDSEGQRLETADGGGGGANFRMVRALHPGTYFVRVESGNGIGGFYTLSVKASGKG